MLLGSVALFFLLAAILIVGSPLLAMAQQTGTSTTTTTPPSGTTTLTAPPPSPPLTPQEQEQQTRLQNVIAATNQNLDEAEKQIGGIVYTPRWSDPVWVEPDSAAVLVAYCLPGEFAESGQEILGGFELEVLESYEVALPQNFTAWMMVIGNEDRQDRLPAAVGVVCASDANDAETRVVSPQEQQQINNVVQQFRTTTTTSIDQVINIINNATTPGGTGTPTTPSGTGTPTTPGGTGTPTITATADPATYEGPCPSSIEVTGTITDNVGNRDVTYRFILQNGAKSLEQETHFDQPGSESVSYLLPGMGSSYQGWVAIEILQPVQLQSNQAEFAVTCTPNTEGAPPAATDTTPPVIGGTNIIGQTPDPAGVQVNYIIKVEDDVDGEAYYGDLIEEAGMLPQDEVGGDIAVSCNPPHGSIFPIGITTVQCSATDAAGNTGTRSFTVTMELIPPRTALAEEQPSVEEAPAEGEPAAPPAEGEPAATEEGEAATTPPVDNTG